MDNAELRVRNAILSAFLTATTWEVYRLDEGYDGAVGSYILTGALIVTLIAAALAWVYLFTEKPDSDIHFIVTWRKEWVYLGVLIGLVNAAYKAITLIPHTGSDFRWGLFWGGLGAATTIVTWSDLRSYVHKRRLIVERLAKQATAGL